MTYMEATHALAKSCEVAVVGAYVGMKRLGDFIAAAALVVSRFNVRATALADVNVAQTLDVPPLGLGRPDTDLLRMEKAFTTVGERIAERKDPPEVARAKVARLARSEPLHAGRKATQEAMLESVRPTAYASSHEHRHAKRGPQAAARKERGRTRGGREAADRGRREPREGRRASRAADRQLAARRGVIGWRRQLNPDACELCTFWAMGGKVRPVDTKFPTHMNCGCVMEPVIGVLRETG